MIRGILIVAVLMVASSTQAIAKDMYKYQDEKGQWVFTDQKPATPDNEDVQTEVLEFYSPTRLITIKNNGPRADPRLYAINDSGAPAQVEIRFVDPTYGVRLNGSTQKRSFRAMVPARGEKFMVKVEPFKNRKWGYRYAIRYAFGQPVHQTNWNQESPYQYKLPFNANENYPVSQGFGGAFSHRKPHSKFAIDISMPSGTPVLAARAGTVMALENNFFRGGAKADLYNRSNFVQILHSDQSIAGYYHLELDSVVVKVGQAVKAGELLGNSGTTGYSRGPHLHFVVQQNQNMKMTAIPFRFEGTPEGIIPQKGMLLSAKNTMRESKAPTDTISQATTYMKEFIDKFSRILE